jgi:integrase
MTLNWQPPAKGEWRGLPIDQWPASHQAAWQEASRRESPLRRGGHAASLSPATRKTMVGVYGQWLWWLQQTDRLDPAGDPTNQTTRELIAEFTILRRSVVSDRTAYGDLKQLTMMMNCIAPAQRWNWIWQHPAAPRTWEARAARRPPRLFPPGLLIERVLSAMREAVAAGSDLLPKERLRDCLIVAIGVYSAMRLRNLAGLRLDGNFIRRECGWEIMFEEHEVKNDQPILCRLSPILTPFIDHYVAVDRPRMLTGKSVETDALWVSPRTKRKIKTQRVAGAFTDMAEEMLGYRVNPHSVRHVQASRILDDDPRALTTASLALAHRHESTVSQYYDSSAGTSQSAWLSLVAEIRSDRGRPERAPAQKSRSRPPRLQERQGY